MGSSLSEKSDVFIKLQNVKKSYGNFNALTDISFDLFRGDFLSIFGPNGAGKSTLLKILSAQTRHTKGKVLFDNVELNNKPNDFRKSFGVISHLPFLYENLSAEENLKFYGKIYSVKDVYKRVDELLKKVELINRKKDLVRNYSRGMLQRLSIARALVHNPDIILLDEPYTGLDQHASYILTNILKEQFEDKKTIIMVTHNLSRGYDLASKILIMKQGKIAFMEDKINIPEYEFEDIYLATVSGS